jgi:small subunit ribosomal protein S9
MATTEKKFIEAIGRRKTSSARARLTPAAKTAVTINDKDLATYFVTPELQKIAGAAFTTANTTEKYKVTIVVKGGGIHSQAEAVRHAISRALIEHDSLLRKDLKKAGFLKRDPRAKERRKFGLKKARKSPQWSKR